MGVDQYRKYVNLDADIRWAGKHPGKTPDERKNPCELVLSYVQGSRHSRMYVRCRCMDAYGASRNHFGYDWLAIIPTDIHEANRIYLEHRGQ